MGRPSSYKEEYCNEAIEYMAKGHSIMAFAGHIGIHRGTIYDWIKIYPEFSEAVHNAKARCAEFWEKQLIAVADSGKGNVTAVIFALKNRAHEEWRDVQKLEHTGKDGGPIETVNATDEQRLRALTAFVKKTKSGK